MSMSDIRTEIEFHINVVVTKHEMQYSKNMDILEHMKMKQAFDFGKLIMDKKGWKQVEPDQNGIAVVASQDLFIFTRNELRDFLDAKIKQKIIEMSMRETETEFKDRLLLLSERV